jgi:hypothetical protein
MIPVSTFAFWLGSVSSRVTTLESEVVRLRDSKPVAAMPLTHYGFATFNRYYYEELPTAINTELFIP